MARPLHADKDIENAIKYAETNNWRYKAAGRSAHGWGRLLCPHAQQSGCMLSIWSTPVDPSDHAKRIKKKVDTCPH